MRKQSARVAVLSAAALAMLTGCQPPIPGRPPEGPAGFVIPLKSQWTAEASAIQSDEHPAASAIDGDMQTRWSSPGSDPQWLKLDLGQPAAFAGCTIHWEAAYAEKYQVLVSSDAEKWEPVYETDHADGRVDELFFPAVTARYLKILGEERGTGWGYSIHEIDLLEVKDQINVKAEGEDAMETVSLFDGMPRTVWSSPSAPPCRVNVDLRRIRPVGGVWIDWGGNYGSDVDLLVSADGESWQKVAAVSQGQGNFDVLEHAQTDARYLRLEIHKAAADAPVQIKEISLCSPGVDMEPLARYRRAARKARRGLYPLQLRKEQVYWTLVGLPGDREESLLDEFGNFEPKAKSPSVMPYLEIGGEIVSALDADEVSQSLEKGHLPLPTVFWRKGDIALEVQAFTRAAAATASATYVQYTVRNTSAGRQHVRLHLLVRPIQVNPLWQYGGLAPIQSLAFEALDAGLGVRIDEKTAFVALTPPQKYAAAPFAGGDIMEHLLRGSIPDTTAVRDAGDQISGVLSYEMDLDAGAEQAVLLAAPLHDALDDITAFAQDLSEPSHPETVFGGERRQQERFWASLVDEVTIDMPRKDVIDTLKSQIAYILINQDGLSIQPGSRNYKRAWIRDGSLTSAALLRMGVTSQVKAYLDWYGERVETNGWVPPILQNDGSVNQGFGWDLEYDSQGEYIFAIMEYYRFTGDREFLDRHFDAMVRAMKFMVEIRNQTLAPDYMANEPARERFVGILPASYSHEGYSPPKHSYWDDFWALKGWKDGKTAALALGRQDVADWAEEQYQIFRKSMRESIDRVIAFKEIDFVPGCAELGDCDPTSTAIGIFPCGEADLVDRRILQNTFDRYYADLRKRLDTAWDGGFTPYEIRSTLSFVSLGQKDRAKELLDYMLTCRRPLGWNHLAEVVYSDPRKGAYIGDMPHTWVGSGYINSVRGLLVQERAGRLHLLPGAPAEWLEGDGIRIENLPTHFGKLNLRAKMVEKTLGLEIAGDSRPPDGFELAWPAVVRPAEVTVDGQARTDYDDQGIRLPSAARVVTARWM